MNLLLPIVFIFSDIRKKGSKIVCCKAPPTPQKHRPRYSKAKIQKPQADN